MVHRIVVLLHDKSIPKHYVINHIDTNPLNNNINNLEIVTQAENVRKRKCSLNIGLQRNNTSGTNGIRETRQVRPSGKVDYYAHIFWRDIKFNVHQKKIPYKKYGKEGAWSIALDFRNRQIELINKEREQNGIC